MVIRNGGVAGIFWDEQEVVRAIEYPIRDVDWGTLVLAETSARAVEGAERLTYERRFRADGFSGIFTLDAEAAGRVELRIRLTAEGRQRVCRAGFVVLHPLGVAGEPLTVRHPDGSSEETTFPVLIKPSQPAMSITGLVHRAGAAQVELAFGGEIFEMEDQRNWSDASYKTYCRPLLKPYPYDVEDGEVVEQSIVLNLSTAPNARPAMPAGEAAGMGMGTIGEFGLAMDPAWPTDGMWGPLREAWPGVRGLARVDGMRAADLAWLASGHLSGRPLDLEIVVDQDGATAAPTLQAVGAALVAGDIEPEHVIVLPRAFLCCIQPWEPQPHGLTLEGAADAGRAAFPNSRIGIGMLSNFVELNRARPAADGTDYVTHGLTPLVHAADDSSVMTTLDALVPIAASLEAIYPRHPVRLGLAWIGMRTNPYGATVAPNPQQHRVAMAGVDPRQRGLFGAAFMVGLAASPLVMRSEFIALAAPYGPFGLARAAVEWPQPGYDEDARFVAFPGFHAMRALRSLSGHRRSAVTLPQGVRGLAAALPGGTRVVAANCTGHAISVRLGRPASVRVIDPATAAAAAASFDWLEESSAASTESVALAAYSVLVADLQGGRGE